jgi:hypothetical protein
VRSRFSGEYFGLRNRSMTEYSGQVGSIPLSYCEKSRVSDLCPETVYADCGFSLFSQSLQERVYVVPEVILRPLRSTSFRNHYIPTIPQFDHI